MAHPVELGKPRPRRRWVELGVNIDHVATVRQARKTNEPEPVAAAACVELGGADQITIHLREDRRHIQDADLHLLRETVRTRLNLEMAASEEMVTIALATRPDSVTLVPERREEVTTEGGLDVARAQAAMAEVARRFAGSSIEVDAFIDPDARQTDAAIRAGFHGVEFHTGAYANAESDAARHAEVAKLAEVARIAARAGLRVKAGHGLTYRNVKPVVHVVEIEEVNIGHSIVARALFTGIERAVSDMVRLIREAEAEARERD
jgi:pyridoxine 5-phosphate synthase